jgi:hypothetical protein
MNVINQLKPRRKRLKFIYGAGDKFGRLTLTGITYTLSIYGHWIRFVEAVCVCGEVKEYRWHRLASGETQSCGCLRVEVTKKRMTTHNLSNHKLYDVWQKMVDRCYNEKNEQFKDYGGRGIEVWKDWKEDFLEFYEWCMANGYSEELSLDREDNDGHYAPYNCRFATRAEQSRNQRRNRFFTAFGETKCLFDWGSDKRCVVSVWALRSRMDRDWKGTFEEALTTPQAERKKVSRNMKSVVMITAFGETKCMTAWLEDERCLVKLDSLRERYRKGWDGEKILTTPPSSSGFKGVKNSKK